MRVKFRIAVYSAEGKKLNREDFITRKSALHRGIRYVVEFKYLEATKWLMLAQDCMEKYLLLGLLYLSLGQEREGREFLKEAQNHRRITDYLFLVEKPEDGLKIIIEKPEAFLPDSLLS
ncbi:MAG: hypothetical protein RMK75_00915 [Aquificaceae bacterium]|nr:hypothetical protein [Aquificaceae bacterium]MDW8422873.1 hypothetical protein [Aquificaceae bacterium]